MRPVVLSSPVSHHVREGSFVLDVCRVRIGSFTLFGPEVRIYTPMHPFDAQLRRREKFGKPVEICARSVVSRDIPEEVFAAGNPCRVIRRITE